MARKKVEPTIDDLISSLPDSDKSDIPRQILQAIKSGKTWSNQLLVDMFRFAPNVIDVKLKSWLPRSIQVKIGKVSPIKVVVRHARHQSSRKKAVYQTIDDYLCEVGGDASSLPPVHDAYLISCPCGIRFIGKEPEHQLQCEVCKLKNKQKPTPSQSDSRNSQIDTMFRIISSRNIKPEVKEKAISILKSKMKIWGFTDEEIINAFENQGYTREQIERM
jgi:hypothetical protein